jgi:hypothetical protein
MKQGAFLMKSLANLNAEFSLTELAYSLRRDLGKAGVHAARNAVSAITGQPNGSMGSEFGRRLLATAADETPSMAGMEKNASCGFSRRSAKP